MRKAIRTKAIGIIQAEKGNFSIIIDEDYKSGLTNIKGFSHLQIVWWGNTSSIMEINTSLPTKKSLKALYSFL